MKERCLRNELRETELPSSHFVNIFYNLHTHKIPPLLHFQLPLHFPSKPRNDVCMVDKCNNNAYDVLISQTGVRKKMTLSPSHLESTVTNTTSHIIEVW